MFLKAIRRIVRTIRSARAISRELKRILESSFREWFIQAALCRVNSAINNRFAGVYVISIAIKRP